MTNIAKQSNVFNIPLRPDADLILTQLENRLTSNGDKERLWSDTITAATGSFLHRSMASVGSDLMFAAERAQHEAFLTTARRPASIYSATQMLGVHIQRKIPSTVAVTIGRVNTFGVKSIPAYARWSIQGIKFFNRQAIFFGPDVDLLAVNLHRGEFASETFTSNGQARQSFIVGPTRFRVSDPDITCTVTDNQIQPSPAPVAYNVVRDGLWEYGPNEKIVNEITTVDGRCRVEFGNGISGTIPPTDSTITISYVVVPEEELNQVDLGAEAFCLDDSDVAGIASGTSSPTLQERSPEFYARNAPYIRSGAKFGNTRDNMRGLALEYPGVIDAVLRGQAEINPQDLRFMNAIETCLLTTRPFSQTEKNQFIAYMHRRSCASRHFYFRDPEEVKIDINVKLFVSERANVIAVEQKAKSLIDDFFINSNLRLGRLFSENEIARTLVRAITDPFGNLISYTKITRPEDLQLDYYQYFGKGVITVKAEPDPDSAIVVSQGTLVAGNRIGTVG